MGEGQSDQGQVVSCFKTLSPTVRVEHTGTPKAVVAANGERIGDFGEDNSVQFVEASQERERGQAAHIHEKGCAGQQRRCAG